MWGSKEGPVSRTPSHRLGHGPLRGVNDGGRAQCVRAAAIDGHHAKVPILLVGQWEERPAMWPAVSTKPPPGANHHHCVGGTSPKVTTKPRDAQPHRRVLHATSAAPRSGPSVPSPDFAISRCSE